MTWAAFGPPGKLDGMCQALRRVQSASGRTLPPPTTPDTPFSSSRSIPAHTALPAEISFISGQFLLQALKANSSLEPAQMHASFSEYFLTSPLNAAHSLHLQDLVRWMHWAGTNSSVFNKNRVVQMPQHSPTELNG